MEVQSGKKWYEEYGEKTAVTLRLAERYRGSNKVVVADSWFGSIKCAEELRDLGLHSIMSVKGNHKGYPKAALREAV